MWFILFWWALEMPKGSLLKQYLPKGVTKVVSNLDCSDKGICQNPEFESNLLIILAPAS